MEKISFKTLSLLSDVVFFLNMAVLVFYSTFITESMTWEIGLIYGAPIYLIRALETSDNRYLLFR